MQRKRTSRNTAGRKITHGKKEGAKGQTKIKVYILGDMILLTGAGSELMI